MALSLKRSTTPGTQSLLVTLSALAPLAALWLSACGADGVEEDQPRASSPLGDGELVGTGPDTGTGKSVGGDFSDSTAMSESLVSGSAAPSLGVSDPAIGSDGATASAGVPATTDSDIIAAPVVPSDDLPIVSEPPEGNPPAAGTLTAGAWDDNLNFERFLDYFADHTTQAELELDGALRFTEADHVTASKNYELRAHGKLDIALVIDTTGSMSDELRYLQTEFDALSQSIEASYPNAEQRWSLVVYRDETDDYVTRWFDFRDDAADFRGHLAAQSSDGGGDFPEASHEALRVMNQLDWRDDENTARLAFWVADAPHHAQEAATMTTAIADAQELGIHIYPIASSGVDEMTELSMRSAAQLTGGRYLFLTDDSGVGGAHKEPSIPCYFVTKLDDAILRMVDIEMSGVYAEPDAGDVIRTGGNPKDGACQMDSGVTLVAF